MPAASAFAMSATRTSVADALSQIGGDRAKLFHTAAGETYGTVDVDGHKEHHRISSAGFQRWLSLTFWRETHMAPPPEAMRQALNLLDARAIHDGEQHEVHMRVAPHPGGGVALDLCDREWRAVVVDANGWKITNDPPVRFRRADGMLALQDPVRGGSIEDLRPYFSAADGADDEIFALALGSLLCAFRPKGPYPITAYIGEHGSLKSTRQRMARQLIDPSKSDLRAAPRNERDLAISAENGWIASFDNVSRLSEAISDALCRLATGGGFSTRELYSDDRERIFDAARPVVLNSIESVITRGDLADRAITIMLPRVEKYRPSDEVWAEFERDRPRLLGALLDAVVVAIQNESATSIDPSIRMADAARWVAAAEPALPFENGTWLAAYAGVREDGHRITVESSVIGSSVLRLLATSRSWSGTATDLLAVLAEIA